MSTGIPLILFVGGLVILLWLFFWSRQKQQLNTYGVAQSDLATTAAALSTSADEASNENDAVLVTKGHGQLVFINEPARRWLGLNGDDPSLEYVARLAQPADSFLELFAHEGQASFQLGERWVQAASHRIPTGTDTRTIVVMRELTGASNGNGAAHSETLDLSLAMRIINEIGETISANLRLDDVYQALLSIVARAINIDAGEICLWDEQKQALYPRGWLGDANYLVMLSEVGSVYEVGEGITGWIAQHRKPVLVSSLRDAAAVRPKLENNPYKSFVAVPLMLDERFLGTFELCSYKERHFGQAELALLQAITKQVSIAIRNAELYAEQAQRIDDMASLQQVAREQDGGSDNSSGVYLALNERIAKLLSAEICGVLLYDEARQTLIAEPPFYGLPYHVVSYIIPVPVGSPQRRFWETQGYWISNHAETEPLIDEMGLKPLASVSGWRNVALITLQIGSRLIGALQVVNKRTDGGFTPKDVKDLRIIASQAAVVVENARLFQYERRRDIELRGLQELAHTIGAVHLDQEFYSEITRRIANLMDVQMCGVLLYDAEHNRLVSQLPFYGIEDEMIEVYVISLQPGSALDEIWSEEDYWYSNQVESDLVVYEAGLEDYAALLGVRKTLLAVLAAGGQRLGVVQVSNRNDGEDFTDQNARMLLTLATQTAALIENARLYREAQRRAEEADSMRHIAELAGSIVTTDDSVAPLLAEIADVMQSGVVFVNILDRQTGGLVSYPRWSHGVQFKDPLVQDVYSEGFEQTVAMSGQSFMTRDIMTDGLVPPSYRMIAPKIGIKDVLIVPLSVGGRGLGELAVSNRPEHAYDEDDERLLSAIASQISATIDRLRLYESTGQNLSRRLQELDAISRVSNELTLTLDLDRVLDVIRHEAATATDAEGSTVVLLRAAEDWQNADQPELLRRLSSGDKALPEMLADIEIRAVQRGADTVLVPDYASSDLKPTPAEARSATAAAFLYADATVGVIHLYHQAANHFDDRAAAFLLTLAAKASLGYANALRYQEQMDSGGRLRRRVEQLNQIFELGQMLHTNVDPVVILEAIAYSVQQSVGYDVVVMLMADEDAKVLRRVAQAGLPLEIFEQSRRAVLPIAELEKLLQTPFRISESAFFPVERSAEWLTGNLDALATSFEGNRSIATMRRNAWHDGDMLIVPLLGAGGELLGAISLDRPQDDLRPERGTIEILEIFAHQAAATIENTRLYLASIRNAEQEVRLNEVMEGIASTLDISGIVESVARGALKLLPFSRMTVAMLDAYLQGFRVLRVSVDAGGVLTMTDEHRAHLQDTALGLTFDDGQDHLYHTDHPDIWRYEDLRAWYGRGEKTSVVIPLTAGGTRLGAIHLGSDEVSAFGFDEYRPVLKRLGNLAAIAVQNARLFDQAINLQSFNESVVESIQQGIVVLDKSGRVISINDFMRERYGWDDRVIQQDLFRYRPALTELLAEELRTSLDKGIPREIYGYRTFLNDKLSVQNMYVYPLRDAESTRGAVLLVEDVTERALLERDIEGRASQLSALTEVSSRITASLDRQEVVQLALDLMERVISYDVITLWRREGDYLIIEGVKGLSNVSPFDMRLEIESHDRLRQVVDTQRVFSISKLQHLDTLPGDEKAQSWLGVPLVNQGNVVGVIAMSKAEPKFYDAQAEQAASAFANQVAIALENADLFAEAEYRTERMGLINRVSVSLSRSLDSENILEVAIMEIAQAMGINQARALLFERGAQLGRVVVEYPRTESPPTLTVNLLTSPLYQHLRRATQSLIFEDVAQIPEDSPFYGEISGRGAKAFAIVPMTVAGQVIGAVELDVFDGPREFQPEQIDLGQVIANQAAIAVQNANLLEQSLVRTRELETLLEAAQATSLTLDLDEVFQRVVKLILDALDMDDCAVMIWDNVENTLEVEVDVNRQGLLDRVTPKGTMYDLAHYPSKLRALREREVIVVQASDENADPRERAELQTSGDLARMLVPLVVRDQAIGLIQVELQSADRRFSYREVRLAQALGSQAAIAIENARLSNQTAAQVEELFLINDLSQAISATISIPDMIRTIRNTIPGLTGAEELYLALYNAATEDITFPLAVRQGADYSIAPRQLGQDEVSFVIRHRRPLIVQGLGGDDDSMGLSQVRRSLGIVTNEEDALSYLGVPLIAGDQVVGALAVRDREHPRAFGLNDQRILTTIGSQLGAAIQNARLFEQIRGFAAELEERVTERTAELELERDRIDTLYRITSELAKTLDMDRVLSRALEMVANAVSADDGVIMLIDPMTNRLYNRAALRSRRIETGTLTLPASMTNGDNGQSAAPNHPAEGLAAWLIDNGPVVLVDDLRLTDYWDMNDAGAKSLRSAMAVVLETNEDIQGVLVLLSRKVRAFSEPQLKLASAAANQVAAAINNADLYHLIRDQAERLGTLLRAEQEEAEKSSAILEGIADGVMLADATGAIVLFNSAAERVLDLPRDRAMGQALHNLTGLFGGSGTQWIHAMNSWAQNPQQLAPGEFLEERLDLGKRVVSVHLSPVHIEDQFLGTVSVFRDITKEVEVDRIKSEFISNVSHELRTPMTSIKGFADLLLMGAAGQVSEQQKGFLRTIKLNADRLSNLVNDLLNISKIDSGTERLNLELMEMQDVVGTVVENLNGRMEQEKKHLDVDVNVESGLLPIRADRHKLTQMITNLVDNAFNYTYDGGKIGITVSTEPGKDNILIAVSDTGIGIPEEFRPRIWDRFERYEEHALVMDVAGTGLGLSIVKNLVEMHHGKVWFTSEVGVGTTFYISLPIDQPTLPLLGGTGTLNLIGGDTPTSRSQLT